ncbi:Uncharacterised protein [Shigella sonnei]|nr:Uncharacterised protein [Shigella sonnei]SVG02923.1 Uncharacterised protein [Shigella flexneri 2a]CSJ21728.1 Uncharacterised protein [Shigella sonnei]CSN46455.1 Uncharacterised protein [Shigella sonnei]CSP95499.1 Uncharacterised protein [Shigella sonnei]
MWPIFPADVIYLEDYQIHDYRRPLHHNQLDSFHEYRVQPSEGLIQVHRC